MEMDVSVCRMNEMLTEAYRSIIKVEEQMLFRLSGGKLTISEMHVLESIGKSATKSLNITEIAQDLDITPPSVTTMIQRLERKGYISKDRSSVDARRVHVVLTPAGSQAEIAHRYFRRKIIRELTAELNVEEKAAILSGLEKMNEFIRRRIGDYAVGKGE